MFDSATLYDDLSEMFVIINTIYKLESFNLVSFRQALDDNVIEYIQNLFDSIVDKVNIRLLDLYYISIKKLYLNNICCVDKTFILFTMLAIIYFVPDISLKIHQSESLNGWKDQFFSNKLNEQMDETRV